MIIPKPSKPDYRLPKAYRPISLLECCGKLLEKVIAKHILSDAHSFDILPPHQFGLRDYHCATDAALCLVHNAQAAVATSHVASTLPFDISGFFDNININRAIAIFLNLGFPPSLCKWIKSFLSNCQIHLSFNDYLSDPFPLDHGTPQGSPLSPILSAIFTSPILKIVNASWSQCSLQMYIDNSTISATHVLAKASANLVVTGFNKVATWLFCNSLHMDSDKAEFITFTLSHSAHKNGGTVTEIALTDPSSGRYPVKRSDQIRYLGIFIHHTFNWSHHVTIMANQACSTTCALNLLRNSVQGLDFANWQRLFHALILPILTYGLPLYANNPRIKGLIKILQVAQNEIVCKMSGTFKTSPIIPLHYLISIPPLQFTIKKLSRQFSLRLQHLPPNSLIRTILSKNNVATWHPSATPTTSLTCAFPNTFPSFTYPDHPSAPTWTNSRVRNNTIIKTNRNSLAQTKTIIKQPPYDTFHLYMQLLTTPSPPFLGSFLLYEGECLVLSGTVPEISKSCTLLHALLLGLMYDSFFNHIHVFLLSPSISSSIFRTSKHPNLFFSHAIVLLFASFLGSNPLHHVDLFRYSIKWSCLPGRALISSFTDQEQPLHFPLSTLPPNPKSLLLAEWQEDYISTNRSANYWQSTICPDGQGPPPFYAGALSLKDRCASSTCLQVALRHGFFKEYSDCFCPHADDNNVCPCNQPTSPHHQSLIQEGSDEGFDHLMSEFLCPDLPSPTPSPRPSNRSHLPHHQCTPPTPCIHYNTVPHVLAHCPLLASPRRRIFGHCVNFDFVFGTFDGRRKLDEFLCASNRLLCPLPLRPDPP